MTIQEDDSIRQNQKSFLVTAENFGGNSSANTTATKPITTQSNKPATQTTLPSVTEKQLDNKGIAAVTVDFEDDFLRGFNADDREARARFQTDSNTPPKTTTRSINPSTWEDSQKELSNKGITPTTMDFGGWNPPAVLRDHIRSIPAKQEIEPVSQTFADVRKLASFDDDFLRGFNEGDEENEIATVPESRDPNFWDLTVNSFKYGYNDSARGQEAWKSMHGQENELDKYNEMLSSDDYNFKTDDWWEKILSGASQQVGQWVRQLTDPETAALAIGSGGAALLAGQAGPQVLLPEEVLTVPAAFTLGMKAGNAKTNMEIEGGNAYLEMLDNGVSEETARAIATGVGGINALLETAQLDELLKEYKVLGKAGADEAFLDVVLRELKNRGIDTAVETGQEVMQESVTIGGTQLGSKIDTGEWAYNFAETLKRLWDTTKESALTFSLTNLPAAGHNITAQNHNRLVEAGEANILAGKMPTAEQLQAMNMTEAEALGMMAVFQMNELDGAENAVAVGTQAFDTKNETLYNRKQNEVRQLIRSDETQKNIHVGHQNKHIKTSNGYIMGRSYIYGELNDAQELVERYHGTGRAVLTRKGEWTNKEIVLAEDVIGVNVEFETGAETETRRFTIHYGKKGTHIVPTKEIEE